MLRSNAEIYRKYKAILHLKIVMCVIKTGVFCWRKLGLEGAVTFLPHEDGYRPKYHCDLQEKCPMKGEIRDPPTVSIGYLKKRIPILGKRIEPFNFPNDCIEKKMKKDIQEKAESDKA